MKIAQRVKPLDLLVAFLGAMVFFSAFSAADTENILWFVVTGVNIGLFALSIFIALRRKA